MPLGPFRAADGKIEFTGNKVFRPIQNVINLTAPDLSARHTELRKDAEKWKNLILIYNDIRTATEIFMKNDGAVIFDLPITTRMISSPGALNGTIPSDVHPFKIDMFGNETFLTQSSQLYLEFAISTLGINKVYCFDKSFRMERAEYSDFLGVPLKVFIGDREVAGDKLTLKKRGESQGEEIYRASLLIRLNIADIREMSI